MGRRERPPILTGTDIIHGFCDRALLHRAQNKVYPNFYIGSFECDILEITNEDLAHNDGLSTDDFKEWFRGYDLSQPLAIIHFTKFRYDNSFTENNK